MTIDPRLTERRRAVAEDRARRNVTRLVRFLIVIAILGAAVWLVLSPLLSVEEVIVDGIIASDAHGTLADQEVVVGRPMALIRADDVERALEADPWVKEATVLKRWPHLVVVEIEERAPIAWVETGEGWDWRAVDGVVVPSAGEPEPSMPHLSFPTLTAADAGESTVVLGALEFADALPRDLWEGTKVQVGEDDELWAEVSGYSVRLGRPVEMKEKALSLGALLSQPPPAGSTLVLIAPTNPAIAPPETGEEDQEDLP